MPSSDAEAPQEQPTPVDRTRADESRSDGRPRRRPRRASSPPTAAVQSGASETPDADWGAWLKGDDDAPARPPSAQDRWYLEQRPPHWG